MSGHRTSRDQPFEPVLVATHLDASVREDPGYEVMLMGFAKQNARSRADSLGPPEIRETNWTGQPRRIGIHAATSSNSEYCFSNFGNWRSKHSMRRLVFERCDLRKSRSRRRSTCGLSRTLKRSVLLFAFTDAVLRQTCKTSQQFIYKNAI